jgi:uncharacterized protein (TIGR03083 family)
MFPIDVVAQLEPDSGVIAGLVEAAPTAATPDCPGWTLVDLGRHLASVHRWAASIVHTGAPATFDEDSPPHEPAALAGFLREGAAALHEVLAASDPDAGCWTFGGPPAVAGFWRRRQALETNLHRRDAETAVGPPSPLPADLCTHGVTEAIEIFYPRQVDLGRTEPLPVAFALAATDTGDRWTIGPGTPVATIAGTVEELYLLLWRRLPPSDVVFTISGDAGSVAALPLTKLTP